VTAGAHRLHGVVVNRRRRQDIISASVFPILPGGPPHVELEVVPDTEGFINQISVPGKQIGPCVEWATQEASCLSRSVTWSSVGFSNSLCCAFGRRLQRAGNCRPPARTRYSPSTASASRVENDRPALPRSGESVPLPRPLEIVPDHARDIASLASALGGETVDSRACRWRPPMRREVRALVLRLARENPRWAINGLLVS
jgi:hypothetical protein